MHVAPLRQFAKWALAASVLLGTGSAAAQMITLQAAGLFFRDQKPRPIGQQPHWVSRSDCLNQDVLHFPVYLAGYAGLTLQVWAGNQGTDCAPANQRQPGGTAECWLLYSAPAVLAQTRVDISAVNLVAHIKPSDTNPSNNVVPQGTYPDVCSNTDAPAGQQLTLYFMLVTSGTTTSGPIAQWTDIGYDVTPPDPPTGLTASAGETRAHISWTQNTASDVLSYQFFCDDGTRAVSDAGTSTSALGTQGPPLGLLALGDGGATGAGGDIGAGGDLSGGLGTGGSIFGSGGFGTGGFGIGGTLAAGGAGGSGGLSTGGTGGILNAGGTGGTLGTAGTAGSAGTTPTQACFGATKLQAGVDPTFPDPLDRYHCGSTGRSAHEGVVDHLVNDVDYVIAVASVDKVGNVGKLSTQACVTPQQETDFFELYRDAGGKAGGGICSLSRHPAPGTMRLYGAAAALAALGLALRLRGRRA